MGWTELRERDTSRSEGSGKRIKQLLRDIKDNVMEFCDLSEDMERNDYGERNGYVEHDGEGYGERRGVRGTGPYGRRY